MNIFLIFRLMSLFESLKKTHPEMDAFLHKIMDEQALKSSSQITITVDTPDGKVYREKRKLKKMIWRR